MTDDHRLKELEKDMAVAQDALKLIPVYAERLTQLQGAIDRLERTVNNGLNRVEKKVDDNQEKNLEEQRTQRRTTLGFVISCALGALTVAGAIVVAGLPQ